MVLSCSKKSQSISPEQYIKLCDQRSKLTGSERDAFVEKLTQKGGIEVDGDVNIFGRDGFSSRELLPAKINGSLTLPESVGRLSNIHVIGNLRVPRGNLMTVEPTCRLDGNAYINDAPNLTKFAPDVSQGRGKMVVFGSNTPTPSCLGIVGSIHISEQNNGKAAEPPSFTVSPDEYLKMCAQGPEGQKGAGGLPIKVVGNVTPNSHPLEYGRLVRSANSLLPADITGGLVIPPGTKTLAGINVGGPLQEGYGSGGEWQPGKFTSKEAFETSVKANSGLAESSRDFGAGKVLHSRRPIEAGSEPDGNSISERFASVAALHKAKLARDSEIRRNAPSIAELNGRMTAGVTTPVVLDTSRLGRGE